MKKILKTSTALILLVSMLGSALISCGKKKTPIQTQPTPTGDPTTQTSEPTTQEPVTPTLTYETQLEAATAAIEAIPETITLADKAIILTAKAAYDMLSKEEKAQLSDETIQTALTAWEKAKADADAGEGVFLSDIDWVSYKMYEATSEDANPKYTPQRNQNELGGILTINGKGYEKGLRTHPDANYDAEFVYDISGYDYTTFSATVGKDSAAVGGYGYIQCLVYGDDKLLAVSTLLDVGSDCYVACDVTGVKMLKIVIALVDNYMCDSTGIGFPMLSNRPVSSVDTNMTEYLVEKNASEATAGVLYDFENRTVALNKGKQSFTVNVQPHCNYFSTIAATSSQTPVTLTISSNGAVIDTVEISQGVGQELKYLLTEGTLTISADCNDSFVTLTDAKLQKYVEKEEIFLDPVPHTGSTADKYKSWLADLSTLPVSFVYDGDKYLGLAGESFRETDRQTKKSSDREQTVITVKHLVSGVDITLDTTFYPYYNAYEWTLYFTNNSENKTKIFSDIRGAEVYVFGKDPTIHSIVGDCMTNYYNEYTKPITNVVTDLSTRGKPSYIVFPYYRLNTSDNGGTFIAVSWAGRYKNSFVPLQEDTDVLRFTAEQYEISTFLYPGETIRSPLVAFLEYGKETSEIGISNLWRRWMIDCNMYQVDGEVIQPQIAGSSSWVYDCMYRATEQTQLDAIKAYFDYNIALDYWWMDAGWYTSPDNTTINGWINTGIWNMDTKRFPTKLKAVSDLADSLNMRGTILWFEPERVTFTAAEIRKIHPEFKDEWLLPSGDSQTYLLLDLSNKECVNWLLDTVSGILDESGTDLYRQDFNVFPENYWKKADTAQRVGITENLYIQGYYSYFNSLHERYPDMYLDTCATGGNRLDLETLRHAVPLHRTDANVDDSTRTQAATQGLYNWIPFSGQPTNFRLSTNFDTYQIRSTYLPSIALNYDYRDKTADWEKLAALVQECRMAMQYCYDDYYELFENHNTATAWRGWEFIDSENNEGVIQLFCPENCKQLSWTIKLYGLNPDVTYVLTDVDKKNSCTMTGKELMEKGFTVTYTRARSSSVIFINTHAVDTPNVPEELVMYIPDIPESAIVVSDLKWVKWNMIGSSSSMANPPYTPNINKNEKGDAIVIGKNIFQKGLRSHPEQYKPADIVYDISSYSDTYTKFFSFVGKESQGGTGKIQFAILVDGVEVARSAILEYGEIGTIEADITGGKQLTLRILDGGDGYYSDSSAFGNPMLMTKEDLNTYKSEIVYP